MTLVRRPDATTGTGRREFPRHFAKPAEDDARDLLDAKPRTAAGAPTLVASEAVVAISTAPHTTRARQRW
tara:strand:- start:1479 stop:1688 length:210 start_codon:yes stop_codon:yes gene_type:complete